MSDKPGIFTSESQPTKRRGQGKRQKIIDAMTANSITEEEFLKKCVMRANEELTGSQDKPDYTFAKEVLARLIPYTKTTMPEVNFSFTKDADVNEQILEVLAAVADGDTTGVTADMGKVIIECIEKRIGVYEKTEMAKDIEEIKRKMAEDD